MDVKFERVNFGNPQPIRSEDGSDDDLIISSDTLSIQGKVA